jgi:hypothetical protein
VKLLTGNKKAVDLSYIMDEINDETDETEND